MKRLVFLLVPLALVTSTLSAAPQETPKTVWNGVYSADEAERGQRAYQQFCSTCHRTDLSGSETGAPALAGPAFFDRWHDLTVFDLFFAAQATMDESPNPLVFDFVYRSPEEVRDIVAYILKANGLPAGQELPTDPDALGKIKIAKKPAS